jgi:hypothetical protein
MVANCGVIALAVVMAVVVMVLSFAVYEPQSPQQLLPTLSVLILAAGCCGWSKGLA